MKNRIWTKVAVGMVAVLVLALSATLAFAQTDDGATTPEVPGLEGERSEGAPEAGEFGRNRSRGSHNKGASGDFLAAELGITTEELAEANAAAREAMMADREAGVELDRDSSDSYLADALGISIEELDAAKDAAREAALAEAVVNGDITQEDVELMQAREALKDYIDGEALKQEVMASLGVSAEELEAAKEAGTNSRDLLEELGLTREDVAAAMTAAQEAAMAQAVTDGVITQEQADQLSENGYFGGGGHGRGGSGHGRRGGPGGQGGNGFGAPDAAPTAPTGVTFGA
jgi:DNA-directed RNA polymerase specialized sigma subunit